MKIFSLLLTYLILIPYAGACNPPKDISRITVAGGSITEIVYLLNMESHLVAVDITSNYPQAAKALPSIGYVRNLSAEGILSLNPTVIIGEDDMGPEDVLTQIKVAGVDMFIVEEQYSAMGIIRKIECVADILGKRKLADDLINEELLPKTNRLEILAASNLVSPPKILFILSMQSGSPIVAGHSVSADGLIKMVGGINAMRSFEGWKPVGTEPIIESNPDVIIISNRGLIGFGDISDLTNHPALRFTAAVKNKKVFVVDGMEMLGFGPRTLSLAVTLAEKITR